MQVCAIAGTVGTSLLLAFACATGRGTSPPAETAGSPSMAPAAAPLSAEPSSSLPAQPKDPGPDPHALIETVAVTAEARAAVGATDRTEEDRALDSGRRPAELLSFCGIRPGMNVAELAAGRGYTAELLARLVGDEGKIYGQNTPFILQRFAEKPWTARLERPVMKPVERIDTEFDDPLPNINGLDAVLLVLFYHDTVWMQTNRAEMNENIYDALAPGGTYCVVDHAAIQGHGTDDAKTLHRIERDVVVEEITAAGFMLDAEATFLQNPDDVKDWNASPSAAGERRGESDRFVLRFKKPEA